MEKGRKFSLWVTGDSHDRNYEKLLTMVISSSERSASSIYMKNYGTRANEANWGLSQKEAVAFSLISHHPSVMMGNAGHHERRDAGI